MAETHSRFFSGTSGLVLPVSRHQYPPAFEGKSRLEYYASLFNSIEINSSFYKMPREATVKRWQESVPGNFQFTFKLSKAITHSKGLMFDVKDISQFMQTIAHVGDKKGCLLVQFPPGLKLDKFDEVEKLLNSIQNNEHAHLWKVAMEFRHVSWYHNEVYDLLNHHSVSMVIHDLPASSTPLINATQPFVYLRFHGPGGRYRGSYSDEFLMEYADYIKACIGQGKTVYFYFNNTMGDALKNLNTLKDFIA